MLHDPGSIDTAPCLYFVFTDDERLISVNTTLCNTLGYSKTELMDASLDKLFSVPSRIFYQTHWRPLLQLQQAANELFISLVAKDKTVLPVLINSRREAVNGIMCNRCVGIVITNRTKYENELIEAKAAYELALQRNSALTHAREQLQKHAEQLDKSYAELNLNHKELSQINKIVTHDLQEPVRKLLYYSDQLNRDLVEPSPQVSRTIKRLLSVTERLSVIISGLQQYMWLTELDTTFSTVDLETILTDAIEQLAKRFDKDQFVIHSDKLPVIRGNPEQLSAMMMHILDNAVRFRKPGERADISINVTTLERNKFLHLKEKYVYSSYVRLTITDNGPGIDHSSQEQVFELFYTHGNPAGVGLGLALTKKIVDHHQGTIEINSEAGSGTTVVLTLPLELENLAFLNQRK